MKLTSFLLYYLVHEEYKWDFEEPSDYPFEVTEEDYKITETGPYGHIYYTALDDKADAWIKEHNIEVVDEQDTYTDLEKAYTTKRYVFSYDDKYYAFDYDYSYYWDDYEPLKRELKEVHPKEITVTVYE